MNSCIQFLNNYCLDNKATYFRSGGLGSNRAVPEAFFFFGRFPFVRTDRSAHSHGIVIRISLLIKLTIQISQILNVMH